MKRQQLFNILLSCAVVVIIISAAEIGLRLFWEMSPSVRRPFYQRSKNPFIRYELIPNSSHGPGVKINSAGFRGPEIKVEKPKGVYRILMLGDSELFSICLAEDGTLPRQLEKTLNSRSHNLRYEVINTGVEGYNTFQEFEVLKTKGLKYSPDLVILNYVLNDPEPGEYYFGNNFFSRNSALYRYILYRVKKALIKRERRKLGIKTEPDHFNYLHNAESFKRLKKTILDMADLLDERNIKLIINIFPTSSLAVSDFKNNYPYWHLHRLIEGIKHRNILYVSPINEFDRLGMTPQSVSINYQYNESHKNPEALKVMAELLYKTIKENNIIKD